MNAPFLSAEWRNLLMANYAIHPEILKKYVPPHTELDTYNNICYISLVGFMFLNTRVQGFGFPFHRNFEEVNLRFYVRFKSAEGWKRGVVFIKEIVPKHMITFVANTIYKEKYATHRMSHEWKTDENQLHVAYRWKTKNEWNHLKATVAKEALPIQEGSEEEYITEHYWGYTRISSTSTGEYEVKHPRWNIHPVLEYDIKCDVKALYGEEFSDTFIESPRSVFLAEGSAIQVMKGSKAMIR